MSQDPFSLAFDALPESLPVFPLPGVILLPGAELPLNIFEPRYLNMTLDCLGAARLIGMLQPNPAAGSDGALCRTGCAGRVTAFSETQDGRLLIVLRGVCRFTAGEELPLRRGYRRVRPSWKAFAADLTATPLDPEDVAGVLGAARRFLEGLGEAADWEALGELEPHRLVDALTMNLPLGAADKQVLLEAPDHRERARLLESLLRSEAHPAPPRGQLH